MRLAIHPGPVLAVICALGLGAARASVGEVQLSRILRDRPKLAAVLAAGQELRFEVIAELEEAGPRLRWDRSEPRSGRASELEFAAPDGLVETDRRVVLRLSRRSTGWDQLAGLIFELHNLRGSARFAAIHRAAVIGVIGKDDYVQQMLVQEFVTLQTTQAFLRQYATGLPDAGGDGSALYWQVLQAADTLKEHIRRCKRKGEDLTKRFRELYDREILPELQGRPAGS